MLAAVIGGTRHVGYAVVELLAQAGHQVLVLNRGITAALLPEGVQRVTVDRSVPGQVAAALSGRRPDVVIDMTGYTEAEVREACAAVPSVRHYVFCSSTAVYGCIGRATPGEPAATIPDSPYTFGKVACEQFLLQQHRQSGFPVTVLRLAHPYGPRDHLLYTSGREALFLDRMRHGRPVVIPGDGQSRMHPIYVADAARAFAHVLGRAECLGRVYNLAGEQILTLDEYFLSIARVLGVPLVARRFPNDVFRQSASLWAQWPRRFDFGYNWVAYESAFDTSALRATGFRCLTDHDAGVGRTLEWLDANGLIPASSDADEEDRILSALAG